MFNCWFSLRLSDPSGEDYGEEEPYSDFCSRQFIIYLVGIVVFSTLDHFSNSKVGQLY